MTAPNILAQIQNQLRSLTFGYYGPRATEGFGLSAHLPIDVILSCDYGQDTPALAERMGAALFSYEQQTEIRDKWDNFALSQLFSGALANEVAHYFAGRSSLTHMVAFAVTEELEQFAAARPDSVAVLGVPAALKQRLDDKALLRKQLPELGIEPIPGEVAWLHRADFGRLAERYGLPLVVQFPVGASGSGTYFVSGAARFAALQQQYPASRVIFCRFLDGLSLSIHVALLGDTIALSYPTIQLIGLPECTPKEGIYCGSDFIAMQQLPPAIFTALFKQSIRLAGWLLAEGYRGLFGLDFLAHREQLYPLEVNPRFQASTDVVTQMEAAHGEVPLALLHVLEFLEQPIEPACFWRKQPVAVPDEPSGPPRIIYPSPIDVAHIWLYNRLPHDCVVGGRLQPGIYRLAGERLVFVRAGLSLPDFADPAEVVVTCGVPEPGKHVKAGSMLLQVQARQAVLDGTGQRLNRWAAAICSDIYRRLALRQK